MSFRDYYSILGITSSATQDEIKKAYKKLAMQYHPDRNAGFQEESEKKMKEINEAYNTLSDSEKRRMYDYDYSSSQRENSQKSERNSSSGNQEKSNKQDRKKEQKKEEEKPKEKQEQKKSFILTLINILHKLWNWSYSRFKRLPIFFQMFIIGMILGGFSTAYDTVFPHPYTKSNSSNNYASSRIDSTIPNKVSSTNSGTINNIFEIYCGLNRLFTLHSIAPESKYYKRQMENNSDVSSQIFIAPKLIAERSLLGIESLLSESKKDAGPFEHSISILKESDALLLRFFEKMKYIQSVDDFKANMIADYAVSANLLNGFPKVFARDFENYPNKGEVNAGILITNGGAMMCNGNADISFWDSGLTELNATSEELGSRRIMQDANFRETPGINGKIMKPLIKGEYVTILDKKKVGSMEWYQVSQYDSKGWVSYLAFVDDPSKASASNCDPINGHIDSNGYCSCNDGYKWMGKVQSCVLASTVSGERILTEMEINIATCGMGGYIDKYTNKCTCDYNEGYYMGSFGKCERR